MTKNLLIGAAIVVALVIVVLVGRSWLSEHDARLNAEATAKQAQQTIASSQTAIADRDTALKQQQAALTAQAAAIKTTPQAVKIITEQIPAMANTPPPVVVDKSQLTPAEVKALPDSPSYAIFTKEQVQDIANKDLSCKSTTLAFANCQADLADEKKETAAAQAESAAWKTAAKGTKWGNFFHALKCIGLSGAGAAVGSLADKQNPGLGAAIGGGAGAVTCAVWR